ncbi:unnamed protein product [Effrenium voratum]|uniref:Probable beta-glucosidase G n=1 Tax=Effrenium voratum TaxID=2562239 RepID=A0AA36HWA2_9DINO|nr:unnamed protein product [Effrenium voratum]CAJ1417061.1 unnamed protein product [Effrenium voratum]
MSPLRGLHAALGVLLCVLVSVRMVRFPLLSMQLPHLLIGLLLASRRLPLLISSLILFWIAFYAGNIPSDDWQANHAWKACSTGSFLAALVGCCWKSWQSNTGRFIFVVVLAAIARVVMVLSPMAIAEDIFPRYNVGNETIVETPWLRKQLCSSSQAQQAVLCGPISPLSWEEAENRAAWTLEQMTDEECHMLMQGVGWISIPRWLPSPLPALPKLGYYMGNLPPLPRLGVPPLKLHDAGNGFRNMPGGQGKLGSTIMWPCSLAFGATWNTHLVKEVAGAIGREYRGKGANVILGPSVQVQRVASNGRNFEYMAGEDPYLGAKLSEAYVIGVQAEGVIACLKHFAFNEQETHRTYGSSVVDERTAWELYYPPFEAGVAAGAGSVMCSYNKVNGTYACANEELLRRDLKQKMGFRGFVMTDWWALHNSVDTSVVRGLDMEMPGAGGDTFFYPEALQTMEESQAGDFKGYGVNRSAVYRDPARRILSAAHKMRLFEMPSCTPGQDCVAAIFSDQRSPEAEDLARRTVAESIVLLKNEAVLPLKNVKRLALIGEPWVAPSRGTDEVGMMGDYYSGGGSGHCYIPPENFTTPFTSISERAKDLGIAVSSSLTNNITEALAAIQDADAVVVLGATTAEESRDRESLHLDNGADDLINAIAKEGKPVIVLMQVPGTIMVPWKDEVAAVALMFLGGEFTGNAWASLLFGDFSPSGRLPIMLPTHENHTIPPSTELDAVYGEGLFTSYRASGNFAAFPFGHGLSYTEFAFDPPKQSEGCQARICVETRVTNTGSRNGAEVVQAYVEFPPEANEPKLVLRGFQKTKILEPGASETVSMSLTSRDLSVYLDGWKLQHSIKLHIGASSADLRHTMSLSV